MESHIPVDSLCDELDQPVFSRGQVIQGFAGDELDRIADDYADMQWWLSDTGLNMAIANSIKPTKEDLIAERAARRCAVVMPILDKKGWTRCRLATEAGLGKNSIYDYLNGIRAKITDPNRTAIAEALDLSADQLPE